MIVSNDIGLLEITNCSDDDDSVEEKEPTNEDNNQYIDDSDQTGTDSEDEDHSNLNFE